MPSPSSQNKTKPPPKSTKNQKPPFDGMKMAPSLIFAGYFVAVNLIEISVLSYGIGGSFLSGLLGSSSNASDAITMAKNRQFVMQFYQWKAEAPILQEINMLAIPILPIILFSSIKEGLWDIFIRPKKASWVRHFSDFVLCALFLVYIAMFVAFLMPLEKWLASGVDVTIDAMQQMLWWQYVILVINVVNTVLPVVKFRDSEKSHKVKAE